MHNLRVVGFDPSLRNWGGVIGNLDLTTGNLTIKELVLTQPPIDKTMKVRQNSKDLATAEELAVGAFAACQGAQAIFVEVPVGSQSARSMLSVGVCLGILGCLRAQGIPFYEVTPNEVKMASVGHKKATKAEMIKWATGLYPDANWPTEIKMGVKRIITGKAEHMADAIAAIHAGVHTPQFQTNLQIYRNMP